jgi:hypothetical protein
VQVARAGDEAMIGDGTDERRCRFDRVDSARLLRAGGIAPGGEIPGEAHVPRCGAQNVAVDREDHVRRVELWHDLDRRAVRKHRALAHVVTRDRIPLVPARSRIGRDERVELGGEGRRGDRAGEHTQAFAPILRKLRSQRCQGGKQALPVGGEAAPQDRAGAIRVVEIEQLRLRQRIGRTEACRMPHVALDLDRPAHLMLDHDSGGVAVKYVGGGVEVWDARNDARRLAHCRNQMAAGAAGITAG